MYLLFISPSWSLSLNKSAFTFLFFKIYFHSKGAHFQSYVSRGCVALRNNKSYFEKHNKIKNFLPSSLGELLFLPPSWRAQPISRAERFLPERSTPLLISNPALLKASWSSHSYLVNVSSPANSLHSCKYQSPWARWRNPRRAALKGLLRFSLQMRLMV